LQEARDVIESLQVAELVNFFQADCLVTDAVTIEEIDPHSGVLYPIILPDRLEIILSQPNQPLRHHTVAIPQVRVERTLNLFQQGLSRQASLPRLQQPAQELYDWLIRPFEAVLTQEEIETLVFVLDGGLRNVPMAALHDGEQYLIEKYAVALSPSLQLFEPQPLRDQQLQVFVAGLTEARQGFAPLPAVATEVTQIEQQLTAKILMDQDFQQAAILKQIRRSPFPIVHFATHGQFSSQAEDTFILTWDDRINVNELSQLLQVSGLGQEQAIELLVLSACQTAQGDDLAALGLAGVAVRAGARSTLATLWSVSDVGTSQLMGEFYRELSSTQLTKAEALRQAQLSLLHQEDYDHPYFWAPFVLIGNWL
jgi:CHAT domain-containing protein